jgi:hypothetical protein
MPGLLSPRGMAGAASISSIILFCFADKATRAELEGGMEFALSQGWLELHENGSFVKLTQTGRDLLGTKNSSDT